MRLSLAGPERRQAWENFVDSRDQAGPYHSWAWLEALSRSYGLETVPLVAESGGEVAGVLPLVRFGGRHKEGGTLLSLPYCDYAGPLARDAESAAALEGFALELAGRSAARGVELRRVATGLVMPAAKVLMRLDLPKDEEALLAGFSSKLRSQVKKTARDGLSAQVGGEELLEPFYAVLSENMRDLGSPVHSRGFFREVLRGFGSRAGVVLADLPDGRVAAAGIVLFQGGLATVPWASSLRRFNRLAPNMLLYWNMLRLAVRRGAARFDFGRSTPGGGTWRFKRQWGARETALEWIRTDALGRACPARPGPGRARAVAESLWKRLPVAVANRIGPALRRRVSL